MIEQQRNNITSKKLPIVLGRIASDSCNLKISNNFRASSLCLHGMGLMRSDVFDQKQI